MGAFSTKVMAQNLPVVGQINSVRLFQALGPIIEKARFPNCRQERMQTKSHLKADRRLFLDKMEYQGVTIEDI